MSNAAVQASVLSPGNEGKIGEIIHVEAKIGTVVGDGVLNNILKVLRGGGGAKGGGVSKGPFFQFFVNNSKTTASIKKMSIY